jgi:membrane associated rhomboid family serine protease
VILPLGDAPNPRGVPLATYALMLANIAVYVLVTLPLSATPVDPNDPLLLEYVRTIVAHLPEGVSPQQVLHNISAYDLVTFEYGFRPAQPSVVALFTSIFMHGGLLHLFGNMLFLWIYGDNVEHRLGIVPFVIAYIATGVAATSFHAVFDSDSPLPLVGASGAISGILGFYFIWFPRNRVRLMVMFFPLMMDTVLVPARLVLGAYLVFDNILPFLASRAGQGGVAYGAHIGGFLGGLAAAWVINRREATATPPEYEAVDHPPEQSAIARLHGDLRNGDYAEAARLYFSLPPNRTRDVLSATDLLELAMWLERNGHAQAALIAYRRHLRDFANGPGRAEAHLGAGRVLLEELGELPPAYQHFLDALDASPSEATALEARRALDGIAARAKLRRPGH